MYLIRESRAAYSQQIASVLSVEALSEKINLKSTKVCDNFESSGILQVSFTIINGHFDANVRHAHFTLFKYPSGATVINNLC